MEEELAKGSSDPFYQQRFSPEEDETLIKLAHVYDGYGRWTEIHSRVLTNALFLLFAVLTWCSEMERVVPFLH